jgi:hypothetical protein
MVDKGTLQVKDCAIVIISGSGNLIINKNLPEKPMHMPALEYLTRLMVLWFENLDNVNYVLIPWNLQCEMLNSGFRPAWRFNFQLNIHDEMRTAKYIVYDIPLCQNIWLDIIRAYRNRSLRQLDIEFNMALEQNDTDGVEEIGLIKKMLRDLTSEIHIRQYDTYEKLTSFWPTILLPAPDFVSQFPPTM